MPRMQKGKVIATDLDGTLFYPKKVFSMFTKSNKRFLRRFINDGGRLVVVTSRGLPFMHKIPKTLGAPCDFICCNGAIISADGEIVKKQAFDPVEFKQLIDELRERYNPRLFLLNSATKGTIMTRSFTSFWTQFLYVTYEAFQFVYREKTVRSDHVFYDEIEKGNGYKMMFLVGFSKKRRALAEKMTDELAKKYPNFSFSWVNQFIEVAPKGCTKAEGVAFYLAKLGLSNDNTLVVGDSGNDVPMFDAFHEQSYCMAHSPASVKTRAAHVIERVSDLEEVLYPSVDSTPRKEK